MLLLEPGYLEGRQRVLGQLVCTFRYGREQEEETLGLIFEKNLFLASTQVFPPKGDTGEAGEVEVDGEVIGRLWNYVLLFYSPREVMRICVLFHLFANVLALPRAQRASGAFAEEARPQRPSLHVRLAAQRPAIRSHPGEACRRLSILDQLIMKFERSSLSSLPPLPKTWSGQFLFTI